MKNKLKETKMKSINKIPIHGTEYYNNYSIVILVTLRWTCRNSFIVRNKQTKTSNRKFPEDPFRNVERNVRFPRFSSSPIRLLGYLLREKRRKGSEETFETNGEGSKAAGK